MAAVAKDGQLAGSTVTAIFTVPTGEVFTIGKLIVRDESGASQTVDVYIDNGGAASGTSNRVEIATVGANSSKALVVPQASRIAQGGILYLKASSGTLNWNLSGATQEQTRDAETIG